MVNSLLAAALSASLVSSVLPHTGTVTTPTAAGPAAVAEVAAAVPAHTGPEIGRDQDWDGDGHADVVGADPNGILHLYRGDGSGGIAEPVDMDFGWNTRDEIRVAGDWTGDGHPDVVARDPHAGTLYLYVNDGAGGMGPHSVIGQWGWEAFTDVVAPGDMNGDGLPDLLAVRREDTALLFYPGAGAAGHHAPRVVGNGWWTRDLLTPVGDWDGDGHADLVARDTADGRLWLYFGDGTGGFRHWHPIGEGWDRFTALYGPGDLDGDGLVDLLAREQDGSLRMYGSNGGGGLAPGPDPVIDSGWNWILMNEPTQVPERVITYSVAHLGPIQSDFGYFARRAEFTLGLTRGWAMDHAIKFVQVPSGGQFTIYLASPDRVAAASPICSTTWSCRLGNGVYINDLRWRQPPSTFAGHSLSDYRHYVLIHEAGHWLGLRHRSCPGPGRLAPVMQQQSISLDGCRANVWPLESELGAVRQNWL